jgi:hypothetical protein
MRITCFTWLAAILLAFAGCGTDSNGVTSSAVGGGPASLDYALVSIDLPF